MARQNENVWVFIAPLLYGFFFSGLAPLVLIVSIGLGLKLAIDSIRHKPPYPFSAFVFTIVFLCTATVRDATMTTFATARCRDGSYSYSAHHSGTCSYHGGVESWHPRFPAWWEMFKPLFPRHREQPVNASKPPSPIVESQREKIAAALRQDEKAYCEDTGNPQCHSRFLQALQYRPVTLASNGQQGLLVELDAKGFCGSGGCSIYVLQQSASGYVKVLEDLGSLNGFQVLPSSQNGYYELYRDGKITRSKYRWTGQKYIQE